MMHLYARAYICIAYRWTYFELLGAPLLERLKLKASPQQGQSYKLEDKALEGAGASYVCIIFYIQCIIFMFLFKYL